MMNRKVSVIGFVFAMTFASFSFAGDLEQLLPANTNFIFAIELKPLCESQFAKKNFPELVSKFSVPLLEIAEKAEPSLKHMYAGFESVIKSKLADKKAVESAMIQVSQTLHRIWIVGDLDAEGENMVVLMQGDFDPDQIDKSFEQIKTTLGDKVTRTENGGRKIYTLLQAGEGPSYLFFPQKDVMAISLNKEMHERMIALVDKKSADKPKSKFQSLFKETDKKQHIWFAGVSDDDDLKGTMMAGLTFSSDIITKIAIEADDKDEAQEMYEGAKELTQHLDESVAEILDDPILMSITKEVSKTVKTNKIGNRVTLELTVTGKQVEKLFK